MEVRTLVPAEEENWDEYVSRHPEATFYHTIGWRDLVRDVQKHEPKYLVAKEGDRITGTLPLFLISTFLSGKKLISVPHGIVGGVCADSDEIETLLIDHAKKIAEGGNYEFLELRQMRKSDHDMPVNSQYTVVRTSLEEPECLFKKLRPDIRRCLRRSLEKDLDITLESSNVDTFYRLYAEGQRNFGTPVEGYKWISEIVRRFPENHRISYVKCGDTIIMVKLMRLYKNEISPVLSYGLRDFQNTYCEHRLIWSWMEHGFKNGYSWFNFGRSLENSGTFKFKMGWNGEHIPLYYYYHLVNRQTLPDYSHTAGSRKAVAAIWRRLPLKVANYAGPKIRRCYP